MPYVNIRIAPEGMTAVNTIDEVDLENRGIGGLPVLDYRAQAAGKARP